MPVCVCAMYTSKVKTCPVDLLNLDLDLVMQQHSLCYRRLKLPPPLVQAFPLVAFVILAITAENVMVLLIIPTQSPLLLGGQVTAAAAVLSVVVSTGLAEFLVFIIAAAGKGIIKLTTTCSAGALASTGERVLLAAGETFSFLFIEQLELIVVAGRVAETTAARHVQVDAEARAEDDDESEGAVNPGLGSLGGTKRGQEAWEPGRSCLCGLR